MTASGARAGPVESAPHRFRTVRAAAVDLAQQTRQIVHGRDLPIAAAGLTFYAAIAIVPWMLLSIWLTRFLSSPSAVAAHLARLESVVPNQLGAAAQLDRFFDAALSLGLVGAVAALLPASFYGEGVRRGCGILLPGVEMFTGWRGRLLLAPLFVLVPVLLQPLLLCADVLARLAADGGPASLLGRILVGFTATWLSVSAVLVWTFRYVAPGRPGWFAAILGALATGSFLAGFLQGFWLFLTIPVDLGLPFGGLDVVGGVIAIGFWLFLLNLVFLIGWATVIAMDRQIRDPRPIS